MATVQPAAGEAQPPSTFALLRRNFWLFFGGIFLLVGLISVLIGVGLLWQESRFGAEGTSVEGTVLGKSIDRGDADEGTSYFVHYRFTDAQGNVRDGRDQVAFEVYDAAVEESPITVEYLASDPATNRVAGNGWLLAAVILVVGLVAATVGAALAIPGWRGFSRERRLWRSGAPVTATVTGLEQANVRFNGRYMWHVSYEYADAAGATHRGRSSYLSEDEAHGYTAGQPVAVKYDPNRPADSVWIGGRQLSG